MNRIQIERDSAEWDRTLAFQEAFIQWFGIAGFALIFIGGAGAIIFGSNHMVGLTIWSMCVAFVGVAMLMLTPYWRTIAESD